MPRFLTAAVAMAVLVLTAAAPGAGAQEGAVPPDTLPAGASLPATSFSLSSSPFSFSSTPFSFASTPVSFSSTPLAAGGSDVGANSTPVTSGLNVKEEQGGALRFTLNADLLFDFDKADLRAAADGVLHDLVSQVDARLPKGHFRVEGHTDGKGTDHYNDELSLRRARSVQTWLTRKGHVVAARITVAGFGRRRPVAPNQKPDGSDDPEGRQKNRRVEILVQPPG